MRTVDFATLSERIKSLNAVTTVLSSAPHHLHPWQRLLRELKNPEQHRPVRAVDENIVDRTKRFNLLTSQWESVVRQPQRGQAKNTPFTKKRCVSLLPSDAVMELFIPQNSSANLALLFDVTKCHLKQERYIFSEDMKTNSKWWLQTKGVADNQPMRNPRISLTELRQRITLMRENNKIPLYNELLVGLSQSGLMGIGVLKNTLFDRLNALRIVNLIKQELNVQVPIIIMNASGFSHYTEAMQQSDLYHLSTTNDPSLDALKSNALQADPISPGISLKSCRSKDEITLWLETHSVKDIRYTKQLIGTGTNIEETFIDKSMPRDRSSNGPTILIMSRGYVARFNSNNYVDLINYNSHDGILHWKEKEIKRHQYDIFIHAGSDLLQAALIVDADITQLIVKNYSACVGNLVSNLLEIQQSLEKKSANHPYQRADAALHLLAKTLIQANHLPLSAHLNIQQKKQWNKVVNEENDKLRAADYLSKLLANLKSIYNSNEQIKQPKFKLGFFGGCVSKHAQNQKVPDGIHQLFEILTSGANPVQQFNSVFRLFKKKSEEWVTIGRDKALDQFYKSHYQRMQTI